jgi:hypothetical protein
MPPLLYSQLAVVGLLGLGSMLHAAWPSRWAMAQCTPAQPILPRRPRAQEPKPGAGRTHPPPGATRAATPGLVRDWPGKRACHSAGKPGLHAGKEDCTKDCKSDARPDNCLSGITQAAWEQSGNIIRNPWVRDPTGLRESFHGTCRVTSWPICL